MYIALKHFEPTIEGYHISIITDHAPLVHIFDAPHKAPSPRLKRWALYMQSFSYEIKYHEGKTHYLADYVSRLDTNITLPENDDPDLGIDCLFPEDDRTFQNAAVTRSKIALKPGPADPKHDSKKWPAKTIPKPPKVNVEPQPQAMTPPDTDYFQDLDRAGIAKHQSEDEFCSDIIAYLKHKHHSGPSQGEADPDLCRSHGYCERCSGLLPNLQKERFEICRTRRESGNPRQPTKENCGPIT